VLSEHGRYVAAAAAGSVLAAIAIGVPTDLLPNPWFTRMTPVRDLDWILWPATSLAIGAALGTYALGPPAAAASEIATSGASGLLGVFAVGCPICNKLMVLLLGASGALTYFEPLQPLLGAAAIMLSVWVTQARLRARRSGCPMPRNRPELRAER
jgi:hypothetical protein